MSDKSIKSKLLLAALVLWMVISQVLGLIPILFGVWLLFVVGAELDGTARASANAYLCIYSIWVPGLSITSWVSLTRGNYMRSLITTSVIFIPSLLYIAFQFVPTPTPTPSATKTPSPTFPPLPQCTQISTTITPVIGADRPSYDFLAEGFAPNSDIWVELLDLTHSGSGIEVVANDQGQVDGNMYWGSGPVPDEMTLTLEGMEGEKRCAISRDVTWP